MSPLCAAGHDSEVDDYCDVCGRKIGEPSATAERAPTGSSESSPSADPEPSVDPEASVGSSNPPDDPAGHSTSESPGAAPGSGPSPDVRICPNCGCDTDPVGRFCESCGYNFAAGETVDGTTKPTRVGWEAIVTADRSFFDRFDVDAVAFPTGAGERRFAVTGSEATIGRRRSSDPKGPTIDLSTSPEDVAVSHDHALLTRTGDGWSLVDRGSSNGTYLNDDDDPLTAGQPVTIGVDDRIHVGAWTTIVLRPCATRAAGAAGAPPTD